MPVFLFVAFEPIRILASRLRWPSDLFWWVEAAILRIELSYNFWNSFPCQMDWMRLAVDVYPKFPLFYSYIIFNHVVVPLYLHLWLYWMWSDMCERMPDLESTKLKRNRWEFQLQIPRIFIVGWQTIFYTLIAEKIFIIEFITTIEWEMLVRSRPHKHEKAWNFVILILKVSNRSRSFAFDNNTKYDS